MKFLMQNSHKVKYFAIAVGFVGVLGFALIAFSLPNQSTNQIWTDPIGDHTGDAVVNIATDALTWFDATNFVDIVQVSLEVPQQGLLRLNLQVAEPIPLSSQDRFCLIFILMLMGMGCGTRLFFQRMEVILMILIHQSHQARRA